MINNNVFLYFNIGFHSFPIDWLANELSENPALAQIILQRFVDANHDGTISANELLPATTSETNENPF